MGQYSISKYLNMLFKYWNIDLILKLTKAVSNHFDEGLIQP
jgi:hypothetical protein